jgi:4-carboxymuconolactone decarboxylase
VSDQHDRRAKGRQKMRAVYGFDVDPEQVPSRFVAMTVDHLFGEVWTGEELDVAQRRLLTIGVLAALGQTALLEIQFSSALGNGELTADQVREMVVHLAHYVGWPLATGVSEAADKAIRSAG